MSGIMNQVHRSPAQQAVTLVFCRPGVDPDEITATLGFAPTVAQRDGAQDSHAGATASPSVGIWKYQLPSVEGSCVEDQLERWLPLLEDRAEGLARLQRLGYEPYLDCPFDPVHLSVCLEPSILQRLGALGVALSVWAIPEASA